MMSKRKQSSMVPCMAQGVAYLHFKSQHRLVGSYEEEHCRVSQKLCNSGIWMLESHKGQVTSC